MDSYQPFKRPWICFLKISTGEFLKTAAMQEGAHFRRPPPYVFNFADMVVFVE